MVSNIIGNKIKMLRNERGLKQGEFAEKLSIFMGRKKVYKLPTVSAWETGRKIPPLATLQNIADFFNIDVKELVGNTKLNAASSSDDDELIDTAINANIINIGKLSFYHNRPLYCVFKNKSRKDEWSLCDCNKQQLIFIDRDPISFEELKENKDVIELYTIQPYGSIENEYRIEKALTVSKIKKADKVWVAMKTFDDYVIGKYNGWYYNDKDRDCLINATGLILPYTGNGDSYRAYLEELNL
jgi:transcriptional regulator with XRE-family HTH domain